MDYGNSEGMTVRKQEEMSMRRKNVYLSAIVAAVLMLQTPILVSADDGTDDQMGSYDRSADDLEEGDWLIDGDVTITDDQWSSTDPENTTGEEGLKSVGAEAGKTTLVNGNVSSSVTYKEDDSPAAVDATDSTVIVNGNVSSENTGAVWVGSNGSVQVNGNASSGQCDGSTVGIGQGGGRVEVSGDVSNTGTGSGIWADSSGATVYVGGSIATQQGVGIGIAADQTAAVEVQGSVDLSSDGEAICTNSGSDVVVGQDVTGTIRIDLDSSGSSGRVVVLGTVRGNGSEASALVLNVGGKKDKESIIDAMPDIVVGKLEGDPLWYADLDDVPQGYEVDPDVMEAIFKEIAYHITVQETVNGSIDVEGAERYDGKWLVAKEGTDLSITVSVNDGYELIGVSGGSASVTRNADGTYTITVPRGGGVDISAIIRAIKKAGGSSPVVAVSSGYEIAQQSFQESIIKQIEKLPATGGTIEIDMKEYISFNKKTLEALAKRPDADVLVTYSWMGKKYRIRIPAGYDMLSLLDANGYCGCLYLNAVFGQELIE